MTDEVHVALLVHVKVMAIFRGEEALAGHKQQPSSIGLSD